MAVHRYPAGFSIRGLVLEAGITERCSVYSQLPNERGRLMQTQRLWMIGFGLLLATQAQAASIGVFCWQLSPTVAVVCFNIDDSSQQARTFTLTGTHSLAGTYRYPATGGVVFDEYAGVYRMNWSTYFNRNGNFDEEIFGADLNPQTLHGTFFISQGTAGPLLFLGTGAAAATGSVQSIDEHPMD